MSFLLDLFVAFCVFLLSVALAGVTIMCLAVSVWAVIAVTGMLIDAYRGVSGA